MTGCQDYATFNEYAERCVFIEGEEAWLKAYIPNVMYEDQSAHHTQESAEQPAPSSIVKGIAFVATREVQDEELLLNYRLNPQVQKPDWYSPVDVEEDKRRWY